MSRNGTRRPITRQRSAWAEHPLERTRLDAAQLRPLGVEDVHLYRRPVHDGTLTALRSVDAGELHLSVSWAGHSRRQAPRYPTWDELADARDQLLPADQSFVMTLPTADEYVAVHDTTFHLHAAPPPLPPAAALLGWADDLQRLDVPGTGDLRVAVDDVAQLLRHLAGQ